MSYNQEQLETLQTVRRHLSGIGEKGRQALRAQAADYLFFRRRLEEFLDAYFGRICTESCFTNRLSACCTREGIVVFFADVVVNALVSPPAELDALQKSLAADRQGVKCVFLSKDGCLWNVRPVVCAMFLCDPAREQVFENDPEAARSWETFEAQRRSFTWPDRSVLFDELEKVFLRAGLRSPSMHLNSSPGLLRVKKKAGLLP